jgi:RNA polymerase sigma-70 factor (ECF subfamily)
MTASEDDASHISIQLGLRLREYYPQTVEIDAESRLGRVLGRLTAALDAAAASAVAPAFKDELLVVVPRLRRYAMSLTHDPTEADDLVQLTLLRAWEFRDRFERGTNLVGWLFTILRNGHLNGRRKYWREVADPDGTHAGTLAEPARQDHTVDLQDLQAALGRLDSAHREALTLVTVEGLTYDAAAAIIGCPAGTVKSRVSRARERLSHELGLA